MKRQKNKLKNYLKTGILLFGISLLLWNCEKQEDIDLSQTNKLIFKQVEEAKLFKNLKLSEKINQINNSETSLEKSSNKNTFDFTVNTENANYALLGDKHTYSFSIYRTYPVEKIENLLLVYNDDEEYDAFILEYDITNEAFENNSPIESNVVVTPIDFDHTLFNKKTYAARTMCSWDIVLTWTADLGGCDCSFWVTTIENVTCNGGGGGSGTSGTGGTGGSNSGTTGGHGGPSYSSGTPIVPKRPSPLELAINSFFNSLTDEEKDFLDNNNLVKEEIKKFLSKNYTPNTSLEDSTETNNSFNFVRDFLNVAIEIPTAKFKRYEELMELIKDNPFVLLEDCIQQNGLNIANYQQLYDHTLPQSCKDRLDGLGVNFQDQPLNTGNAAVANVDYYGVEVTTNPDFNGDGNPDSNADVYQKYREDFGELASGGKDNFQFSCDVPNNSTDTGDITWEFSPYFSQDLTNWNSSNPLTTIFKIEAGANMPGVFDWLTNLSEDDGAIMISAYTPNYWIGSTIATEFSGTQPFSGNRQWGWLINQNNKLELFARAVDIARVSAFTRYNLLAGSPSAECKEDTYYNIGEETWSNLQNEIKQWINDNDGQAEVIPKTAIRFDKTKLKELLESNETIDEINCN